MRFCLKNTRFLIRLLVILCLSDLLAGCLTEAGNNYKLSSSEKRIQGGATMGKVSSASDAYSHAKFIDHDH